MSGNHDLHKNSVSMMLATMISRIFGLVRVQVISFLLGTTRLADIWGIAFLMPNLFRRLIAEGAMTAAFVPLLSAMANLKQQIRFSRQIFTVVLVGSSLFSLVVILLLPWVLSFLVSLSGSSHSEDVLAAVAPSQIVFPFLIFTCVNAVCYSFLNVRGQFFIPAITPVVLSIFMIFGGLAALWQGWNPVWGLAAGVLIGGLGQFLIAWQTLAKDGIVLLPQRVQWNPQLKKAFLLWLPTTFGAGVFQINLLVSRSLSFNLFDGAVAALEYSERLTELVMGIFTTSVTTALLPLLSKYISASKDKEAESIIQEGLIHISFFSIPATVGLILSGFPLIGIIFKHGEFNSWSQMITYGALMIGALALIPFSWYRIISQLFYAHGRITSLVAISIVSTLVNIAGLFFLPTLFPKQISHLGINLSLFFYSWFLYGSISCFARRYFGFKWSSITGLEVVKNLFASVCMVLAWLPLQLMDLSILEWLVRVCFSVALFVSVSWLTHSKGLHQISKKFQRRKNK